MSDSYPGPYRSEFLRKADETSSPLDSKFGTPGNRIMPGGNPKGVKTNQPLVGYDTINGIRIPVFGDVGQKDIGSTDVDAFPETSGRPQRLSERLPPILGATRLGQRIVAFEAAQAQMRQQELVEAQAQLTLMGNQVNTLMELDEGNRDQARNVFADEWEARSPGMGKMFRNVADSKLAHAADLQEVINLNPVLRAAMASGGLEKVLSEYNSNESVRTFIDGIVTSNYRDKTIEKAIGAARYLQTNHAKEFSEIIGKDGVIQSGELVALNRLLPENKKLSALDLQILETDPTSQDLLGFEPSARALAREEVYAKIFKEAQIKDQFEDTKPINILTPDGKARISYDNGRTIVINGKNVPVPEGSTVYTARAQGTTADIMPGVIPGRKEKTTAGAEARKSSEAISQFVSMLDQVAAADPGATGMLGSAAQAAAGVIGQFSPDTAGAITEYVTGMSPEQLSYFQTQLATVAPKTTERFTAEESGRITDKELAIATKASKAQSKTASKAQIVGALRAIIFMDITNRERNMRVAGIPSEFDFSTEEGQAEALHKMIYQYGLDPNNAGHLMRTLIRQNEMLESSGAKKPHAPE